MEVKIFAVLERMQSRNAAADPCVGDGMNPERIQEKIKARVTVRARFDRDRICKPCRGSGKRGRGQCSACHGKGEADLAHPRIRFNWGYHDGAFEQVEFSKTRDMSTHFDWWYAQGYERGIADAKAGTYANNSCAAWTALSGMTDDFSRVEG